ncbi:MULTISPECIES: hypothetical protein [unclassified Bradyrhizobium]|uniref:hypothetical protein n=1 Tax=unclassified Bradyrhizobium TaxID=2631580 RepID=UPI001FFA80F6|nr:MULTISPECIES: hypothetical protein [unclassified Bradyrhizobium]MCK1709748.1 hypothetical protein [Bradyrhizobium sp. 143]MCK1724110.1 hypothetical protein [Bradyrhizobium sp. 142]
MLIDLSRVRVSGPLSAFATGFADHMTRQGYSPQQARFHLLLLNHLSNWLVSEGLDVGELCANEIERFQRSRHEAGYSFLRSIRAMQPILGYLRGLGIAPAALLPPASGVLEAALARYRGYLILERGIKDASASRYIELMRPFLQKGHMVCVEVSQPGSFNSFTGHFLMRDLDQPRTATFHFRDSSGRRGSR